MLLLAAPVTTGDVTASGKVTPADAASAVLVASAAVRLLRDRSRPLTPAAAAVLGAPALGLAAAAATSLDPGSALTGFLRYVQVFVAVPAAVVLLLRDRRDFGVIAASIVLLALVQGAVGTWQYATATGASYMGEDIRAVGTFGPSDVMGMATVVAYGLVTAVGYALVPPPSAALRWVRPAAMCCAALLVVPLVAVLQPRYVDRHRRRLHGDDPARGPAPGSARPCGTHGGGRRAGRRHSASAPGQISERAASITRVTDAPDPRSPTGTPCGPPPWACGANTPSRASA